MSTYVACSAADRLRHQTIHRRRQALLSMAIGQTALWTSIEKNHVDIQRCRALQHNTHHGVQADATLVGNGHMPMVRTIEV